MHQIGERQANTSVETFGPSVPPPCIDVPPARRQKLTLRRSFSWMFISTVLSSVLRWGMLIFLVKIGEAKMVGVWTLAQAICLPVFFLTGLNLESALMTDTRREFPLGQCFGLRLMSSVVMIAIIAVTAWAQLRDDWFTFSCVLLFGLGTAIQSFEAIVLAVAVQNECADVNARSQVITSAGSLVAMAVLLWLTRNLLIVMVGIMVVRLAALLLYDLPVVRSVDRQFHPNQAGQFAPQLSRRGFRLAWVALPLGIAVATLAYANNMPVYFLKHYYGTEMTGYYGGLNSFIFALNIFLVPLFSATGPRLNRDFHENRRRFVGLLLKVSAVFLVGGVLVLAVLAFIAPWLLRVLLRAEYAAYSREFMILMAMGPLYVICQFLGFAMQAARGFWLLLMSQAVVLIASAITSWALVPSYGLWGAVWSRVITVAVWMPVVIGVLIIQLRRQPQPAPAA